MADGAITWKQHPVDFVSAVSATTEDGSHTAFAFPLGATERFEPNLRSKVIRRYPTEI
jgi:hypothetical protein